MILACAAFLVGIALSYLGYELQPVWFWLACSVVGVGLFRLSLPGLVLVLLLGLALGLWRGGVYRQWVQSYEALHDTKVELQITAQEDAVYGKHGQITFVAGHIIDRLSGQKLPGKISVSGFGENAIFKDDVLIAAGKLRPGIGSYQGFMSYAQLQTIEHHPSIITTIRRNFAAGIQSSLPEPLASFGMGILIGQRATLPDDVKENLQMVGLTHIIAVSGANLTIMLDASRKLLGKKSKRLSTALTVALMTIFVLLTGGGASIIRAAFVSSLSIAAAYYGRRTRPLLIILLVAAITAWLNPIYVWGDASWYLSFLAFYGVLMVSPLLQNRLPEVFERSVLLGVALESICAEIMSMPYIVFTFGQMSFVGLIANVLVVALIPLAMLLSFIAGLGGTFLLPVCGWFAWPAKYVLMYMLDMAHLLADIPHIFIENISLSVPGLILWYGTVAIVTGLLTFKDTRKGGIITDKKQGSQQ